MCVILKPFHLHLKKFWTMAVVSTDHADEKLCAEDLLDREDEIRSISVDEVEKHNGKDKKSFWAVIDGTRFRFYVTLR